MSHIVHKTDIACMSSADSMVPGDEMNSCCSGSINIRSQGGRRDSFRIILILQITRGII